MSNDSSNKEVVIDHVPLDHLPHLRKAAIETADGQDVPLKIKRWLVDGHDGKRYGHNEINELVKDDGLFRSDEDMIEYLRKQAWEAGRYKIYFVIQIFGEITDEELSRLPADELSNHMKIVLHHPEWEPLKAYNIIPPKEGY